MSDKPIKVAVLGASGRMGQAIIREVYARRSFTIRIGAEPEPATKAAEKIRAARRNFSVSGALVSDENTALGRDVGGLVHMEIGVEFTADASQALIGADVAIDVATPGATDALLEACVGQGVPLVIGTTGLDDEQLAKVEAASEQIPALLAANFTKGICVLAAVLEQVVEVLGPDWDAEISESHHRGKKDVPSGTALALGEQIAAGRGRKLADLVSYRSPETGQAKAGQIGMHSIRAGDMAGEHRILLSGMGEQLELLHRATDRAAFARGALAAAAWLAGRKAGLYGMADVFGL